MSAAFGGFPDLKSVPVERAVVDTRMRQWLDDLEQTAELARQAAEMEDGPRREALEGMVSRLLGELTRWSEKMMRDD